MRVVSLGVLKSKLREYVRLAARGATVLIKERDLVVAELCAPRQTRARELEDARFAELVREGLITPARRPPSAPLPVAALARILGELERDRAGR